MRPGLLSGVSRAAVVLGTCREAVIRRGRRAPEEMKKTEPERKSPSVPREVARRLRQKARREGKEDE